jgi:hypothetical protein
LTAYQAGCDGISLCLVDSGPGAFDFDNCRDSLSGTIRPAAQSIIDHTNSYVEVSTAQPKPKRATQNSFRPDESRIMMLSLTDAMATVLPSGAARSISLQHAWCHEITDGLDLAADIFTETLDEGDDRDHYDDQYDLVGATDTVEVVANVFSRLIFASIDRDTSLQKAFTIALPSGAGHSVRSSDAWLLETVAALIQAADALSATWNKAGHTIGRLRDYQRAAAAVQTATDVFVKLRLLLHRVEAE